MSGQIIPATGVGSGGGGGGKLMRKMGNSHPLLALAIRSRQTVVDRPKLPIILGEPWVISWSPKMALFVANSGPTQVRGRTTKAMHRWGIPDAIKVRNMASRASGRSAAIPQNFRRIAGTPSVSENGPFLVDNRDWELAEFRGKSFPRRWRGVK